MSSTVNTRASWKVVKPSVTPRVERSRRGPRPRSWTEQEEHYLLTSRDHRLPYRRIATHLRKTELACRLHYHQLTVVKARQTEDGHNPAATSPEAATTVCDEPSPEPTQHPFTTSPETEFRTLPSLRRWLDQSNYLDRSTSLPTPTPSRAASPQSITSQRSAYEHNPGQLLLPPPTPPQTQRLSPRPFPSTGLGVVAMPPMHQRTFSFPPLAASRPQHLPPPPQLHADVASHWDQWQSRRIPIQSRGSHDVTHLPAQTFESAVVSVRKPGGGGGAASTLDRCSVHSLLNP